MGRFNFNNYDKRNMATRDELDVKRLTKELVHTPSKSYKNKQKLSFNGKPKAKDNTYQVGVILYFMSGQTYKTPEFTVDDIYDALQQNKRWLDQENGGAINLGYVVRYNPYKFYERENHGRA